MNVMIVISGVDLEDGFLGVIGGSVIVKVFASSLSVDRSDFFASSIRSSISCRLTERRRISFNEDSISGEILSELPASSCLS